MKTVKLTQKELDFIEKALWSLDGIYDYHNHNDKEFKERYGVSPKELDKIVEGLKEKINK